MLKKIFVSFSFIFVICFDSYTLTLDIFNKYLEKNLSDPYKVKIVKKNNKFIFHKVKFPDMQVNGIIDIQNGYVLLNKYIPANAPRVYEFALFKDNSNQYFLAAKTTTLDGFQNVKIYHFINNNFIDVTNKTFPNDITVNFFTENIKNKYFEVIKKLYIQQIFPLVFKLPRYGIDIIVNLNIEEVKQKGRNLLLFRVQSLSEREINEILQGIINNKLIIRWDRIKRVFFVKL